jgi:hypothetical protein
MHAGSIPPAYFTRFGNNAEAALTDKQKAALIAGLEKAPGMAGGGGGGQAATRRR